MRQQKLQKIKKSFQKMLKNTVFEKFSKNIFLRFW